MVSLLASLGHASLTSIGLRWDVKRRDRYELFAFALHSDADVFSQLEVHKLLILINVEGAL
jgi:hypothetical protein